MNAARKGGGSTSKAGAERTREALVGAAVEVLAERGYAGATARVVAGRADCNQALVFYHFGSVDGLLLAALDSVSARRLDDIGPLVDRASTLGDLLDVLEHVVTADVSSGDLAVLVALLGAGRGDPELATAVGERLQAWQELTERAVRRATTVHPLGALVPVAVVARLAMATVLGLELLESSKGQHAAPLDDLIARLRALADALAINEDQELDRR